MNFYFRIWWLSLLFVLLFEILVASFFRIKPDTNLMIIFVPILLPLFNNLIQEVKKEFFWLGVGLNRDTLIKWVILVVFGIVSQQYGATILQSMIGFYLLFSIMFLLDSRVSFLGALVFLTFCPVLLITDRPSAAENFAILAYYFLCIGVVTQILESIFNKHSRHAE